MVDVSSMQIQVGLDTTEVDRGISSIETGFSEMARDLGTLLGPFKSVAGMATSMASSLAKISGVGVAGITALATQAPAVAPSLAKMATGIRQLSFALGEQLQPIFQAVANDYIPALTEAIENNEGAIGKFVNTAAQGITDTGNLLSGNTDLIKNFIPKGALTLAGAAAGFALGGPYGMIIGAALGYAVTNQVIPEVSQADIDKYGVFAETASSARTLTSLDNVKGEGIFSKVITKHGQLQELSMNAVFDFFEWVINKVSDKELAYADQNGVPR